MTGRRSRQRCHEPRDGMARWIDQHEADGASVRFQPWHEVLERKQLLTGGWPPYISRAQLYALLHDPVGNPAVRPNTPVMPYGTASKLATYIDPSTHIVNGYAVIVGGPSFIGPYATLNAHGGIIKIGNGTDILDNASIVANPLHPHTAPAPEVLIGNRVLVNYGAQILGPSKIGSYGSSVYPTEIGAGAVIDQANVEPGAIVSPLAHRPRGHGSERISRSSRQECHDERRGIRSRAGDGGARHQYRAERDQHDAGGQSIAGNRVQHPVSGSVGNGCECWYSHIGQRNLLR